MTIWNQKQILNLKTISYTGFLENIIIKNCYQNTYLEDVAHK